MAHILRKPRRPRATIDFEARSAADIRRTGAWLYSTHPTTEPHCLAYHLPGMDPAQPRLWHRAYDDIGLPATPPPEDLFDWIAGGGFVEAHNAGFEVAFWQNQMVENYFWPTIDPEQWLCSAAKASALALPRGLEDLAEALRLNVRKNDDGKAFIRDYCKPKRLTKAEKAEYGPDALIFREDVQGLRKGFQYCRDDVSVEIACSTSTDDLSPDEERLWRVTMAMNARGVRIDTELAKSALILAAKAKAEANNELVEITRNTPCGNGEDGVRGGQREMLKAWLLANENLELANTQAKTLEWYTDPSRGPEMSERCRRVLTIVREVNRTSTNKYKRMLERVDGEGIARELMVYCGAERTGRFSSSGIQAHNLPKGRFTIPLPKEEKGNAIIYGVEDVKTRDLEWCKAIHGDVMNLVASCLRGAFISRPGRELITADYSAIEARVVLWLADATGALQVFYEGGDIYCDMASGIYGREITKATVKTINAMGATERDFGKVAILGLGYNMGWLKFLISMRSYNIVMTRAEVMEAMGEKRLKHYEAQVMRKLFPKLEHFKGADALKKFRAAEREAAKARLSLISEREEPLKVIHELALCKYTVETYRSRYPEIPALWKAQEAAAIKAIETGKRIRCGKVVWFLSGRFLKCKLPGGRCLNYASPKLVSAKTSWGETKPQIRFMGRDQTSGRWSRQATYGGKLVENITQATARDIMGYAKRKLAEQPEYDLLLSVHDEIIAEVDTGVGDEDEFAAIMSDLPECYAGCPIDAEPQRYTRYRK